MNERRRTSYPWEEWLSGDVLTVEVPNRLAAERLAGVLRTRAARARLVVKVRRFEETAGHQRLTFQFRRRGEAFAAVFDRDAPLFAGACPACGQEVPA